MLDPEPIGTDPVGTDPVGTDLAVILAAGEGSRFGWDALGYAAAPHSMGPRLKATPGMVNP